MTDSASSAARTIADGSRSDTCAAWRAETGADLATANKMIESLTN